MGVLTDYFIAASDAEAAGALKAIGGTEEAGLVTVELKGVDPVVDLATLESILTGADPMDIISKGEDPVGDGGRDGPWVLRVRRSLQLLDVLYDLGGIAKQSLDQNKSLYCWTSL